MAKLAFNNKKKRSTGYTSFEFNYGIHPKASHEKEVKLYFKSKSTDKVATVFHE